jgi:hypothetical protein
VNVVHKRIFGKEAKNQVSPKQIVLVGIAWADSHVEQAACKKARREQWFIIVALDSRTQAARKEGIVTNKLDNASFCCWQLYVTGWGWGAKLCQELELCVMVWHL